MLNLGIIDAILVVDRCCQKYQVTLQSQDALELTGVMDSVVQALVRNVNGIIPHVDMGPTNPNTGHPHHEFSIGREHYRVVYLRIIKIYMPKEESYLELEQRLDAIGKEWGATERDVIENTDSLFTYRFWWDKR